jgi:hypothetical protein
MNLHNYGFKKTIKSIHEDIMHKHDKFFLAPIDLMIPVDGVITAAQYIIISRYIDIERLYEGKNTIWDKRLGELDDVNRQWTENDATYYRKLIKSLDSMGWDYNISSVFVNKEPLYAYNGTHRLAYALKRNPYQVIPIIAFNTGWLWSVEDGKRYWINKGLSCEEMDILTKKYVEVLKSVDKTLFLVVPKQRYNEFIPDDNIQLEEINEYRIERKIYNEYGYNKNICLLLNSYFNNNIIVIRFSLKRQVLKICKHSLVSLYIDKYMMKYKTSDAYATQTITEANQFRLLLKSHCTVKQ